MLVHRPAFAVVIAAVASVQAAHGDVAAEHGKRLLFGLIPDSNVAFVSRLVVNNGLQAACTNILQALGATKTVTATPTATATSFVFSPTVTVGTDTTTRTIPATVTTSTTATEFTGTSIIVTTTSTTEVQTTVLPDVTETAYVTGAPLRMRRSRKREFAGQKAKRAVVTPLLLQGFVPSILASGCAAVIGTPVPLTSTVFAPAVTTTAVLTTSLNVRVTESSSVTSTSTETYQTTTTTGPAAFTTTITIEVTTTTTSIQPVVTAFCPPEATYADGVCTCSGVDQLYVGTACVSCQSLGRDNSGAVGQCGSCPAGTYATGSSCTPCAPGFVSAAGASVCTACPAGTFAASGAASCPACRPGTFSAAGAPSCSYCPRNTFSSSEGTVQCTPCGPKRYSYPGSLTCPYNCMRYEYAEGVAPTTASVNARALIDCTAGRSSSSAVAGKCNTVYVPPAGQLNDRDQLGYCGYSNTATSCFATDSPKCTFQFSGATTQGCMTTCPANYSSSTTPIPIQADQQQQL